LRDRDAGNEENARSDYNPKYRCHEVSNNAARPEGLPFKTENKQEKMRRGVRPTQSFIEHQK